jgi:hypothetical protein
MTDFVSDIQKIPYSSDRVFAKLSDLNNLDKVKSLLPEGKIKDFTFDADSCSFQVETFGKIALRVVEREPFKTIKLESEKSPVPFTIWIQIQEAAVEDTRLKLTFRADIPFLFKGMIAKPLEEGIKKVAEALAQLPY